MYTKPYRQRRRIRHDEITAWRKSVFVARDLVTLYSVDMARIALTYWGMAAWKPNRPRCVSRRRWARENAALDALFNSH